MVSLLIALFTLCVCSVAATNYQSTNYNSSNNSLPPTLELIALHAHTLAPVGCILSSGNFTTNTLACFPFRAFPLDGRPRLSKLTVAGTPCRTDNHTMSCPNDYGVAGVFTERAGLLAVYTGYTETKFSVDSLEDGGLNSVGLPNGVPLFMGCPGNIGLVLQVKPVSG